MTKLLSRRGIGSAAVAALVAALGVFSAVGDPVTVKLTATADLNYETALVKSAVTNAAASASLTLIATDPVSGVSYYESQPLETSRSFTGLTAARAVALDGYVLAGDGVTTNASAHELLLMGNPHDDGWVHENADTYAHASGSGVWANTNYVAVTNSRLSINTKANESMLNAVTCTVGSVPRPRRGYTLNLAASFPHPYTDYPDPSGERLGLTTGCPNKDDLDQVNFAYVENGAWTIVPASVCDPHSSTNWQVSIAVDCESSTATYYVRASDSSRWIILGTAANVGSESVTVASFRGEGALERMDGHGFDTQLIQVDVEFDAGSLHPGINFEETIVTGRVISSVIHATDRLGGTYTVRLTDRDGNVIETTDYDFTATGTMEFYFHASDLTAGASYRAEVILGDGVAEANTEAVYKTGVMARGLTNELWGTEGVWIYENARTFDGDDPGTGDWSGQTYASTSGEWIDVQTVSFTEDYPADAKLSFAPTNDPGERVSSYSASVRVVFTESGYLLDGETNGVFATTVYSTEDGLAFACLSNRTWQIVSRDVVAPTLGEEYELFVYVEKDSRTLDYYVTDPEGNQTRLMAVELDADLAREFESVDFIGVGRVTDLTGRLYSSDLLRIHATFDADALYPGTNFEASAANGYITFEKLWETDHTNGQLRVVVRDKYGSIVGQRRISFHDLSDRDFKYYIEGLQPGETYTVEVNALISGVDSDNTYASGAMWRVVTNALWATEGWIREDVDTFAGRKTGTGVWLDGEHLASEADGYISINTSVSDDESANVGFLATNALPNHTGFEMRSRLVFDAACTALPTVEGDFGVAVVDVNPDGETAAYRLTLLVNGVWTTFEPGVYLPALETEYEVTVRVDHKRELACYLIQGPDDDQPVVVTEYEIEETPSETPYRTEFYGTGRVRTHEGDGFDVSLVEIEAEIEEDLMTAGTNFAATVVKGVLHIKQIWLTDKTSGSYTIYVRDAQGQFVLSKTLTYAELVDQNFNVPFEGLEPGKVYDIEIVADLDGDFVSSASAETVMAREIGEWIREDAETFSGEEVGTGVWSGTNGTTEVVAEGTNRAIRVTVSMSDEPVLFTPTNDTLSVRNGSIREIRMNLNFADVGWYATEAPPSVPTNALAGVTVWAAEDTPTAISNCAIAVITTNRAWTVVEKTGGVKDVAESCVVRILIDYANGLVRYGLEAPSYTNTIYQYDFDPYEDPTSRVAFDGGGTVTALDGDVWDPNLILGGTNEFADLDSAIRATDPDTMLSPLWWADQLVTVPKGSFKVDDPEKKLTVRFPWWYYVVISTNGSVRVFRFNQSNNWIDYAADGDENVVVDGSVFLVKTPEGLSWIAAQALTNWISGRIELAGDIDLTAHNWTPIAGFTGTFDGKAKTIRGLNNSYRNAGIPGGEYVSGPTNVWGRSTYGLFGTATNATLTGVTFADVAISNVADSVAALAGALAGNCAVSNVTVESGTVRGLGGTVAGVAGFADFENLLAFVNNTNRAGILAESALYGEGRWAAGLLCVGGPTNAVAPLGTVVVTNNANYGTVTNAIYDTDLFGGNVAQILAGATRGARFGDVHLTNNLAAGSVEASLVRSPDNAIVQTNFPAVNLASAFWGYDAFGTFYRFLDANRAGAIAVDPVLRTARMLSGTYANGTENAVGLLNDEISALASDPVGSVVTMTDGLDSWGPIVLDRDLTFDLGGQTIYTVYVNDTFVISNGVTATIRNGTIAVGPESHAFTGDTSHLTVEDSVTVEDVPEDFYERTTVGVNGEPISALYSAILTEAINRSGTVIELYEGAEVEIDADAGELKVNGLVIAKLTDCYGFKTVSDDDGNVIGFQVKITDSSAPTAEFSLTGGDEGSVSVTVGNAKAGFWYALEHKSSLAEEWITPPSDEWVQADANGATITAPTDGSQGYYRVLMSDVPGGGQDE